MMKRFLAFLALVVVALPAAAIDHSYKAWDDLLKKHVRYVQNGNASRVDYAGVARDRAQLEGRARRLPEGHPRRVRRLDKAPAAGVPHQRVQRVHDREDPSNTRTV